MVQRPPQTGLIPGSRSGRSWGGGPTDHRSTKPLNKSSPVLCRENSSQTHIFSPFQFLSVKNPTKCRVQTLAGRREKPTSKSLQTRNTPCGSLRGIDLSLSQYFLLITVIDLKGPSH